MTDLQIIEEGQQNDPQTEELDQFDPERLRLSQDFAATAGVKKAILTIPVRKPGRQDFVRVHPDPAYRIETAVLELKDEGEAYLVDPDVWPEVPGEVSPRVLFTTMSRRGVLTLWPVRLPSEDGRHDDWSRSALEAAQMAQKKWIRMASNRSLGAYEVFEATGSIPEPEWSDLTFQQILRIAFKDRFIDSLDHPVLKQLRGAL